MSALTVSEAELQHDAAHVAGRAHHLPDARPLDLAELRHRAAMHRATAAELVEIMRTLAGRRPGARIRWQGCTWTAAQARRELAAQRLQHSRIAREIGAHLRSARPARPVLLAAE